MQKQEQDKLGSLGIRSSRVIMNYSLTSIADGEMLIEKFPNGIMFQLNLVCLVSTLMALITLVQST